MWVKEIFIPVFGPQCTWGSFHERLFLHNVLRAALDIRILAELNPGMDTLLQRVKPEGWLPFVKDHHLVEWRDLLFPQLQPGATTQTVEVFSSRQGISAPEFQALLGSEERMQNEVFRHLPLEQVQGYRQRVLDQNARLISAYMAFSMCDVVQAPKRNVFQGVQP
jgi:hypothetical protein